MSVDEVAVENFLASTNVMGVTYQESVANVELDARLYGWNRETTSAIRIGLLHLYFGTDTDLEGVVASVCPLIDCNADLGHPCDADDGEPCPRCQANFDYWQREWDRTPPEVRRLDLMSKEELDQELRDAGRGHLVRK